MQIAQTVVELTFVNQVGHAVDQQIFRSRHMQCGQARHSLGARKDASGVGDIARRQWQDGVVDVDHGATPDVHHRRQFMHPLPVVALVVGVRFGAHPAVQHERALDVAQSVTRHQHVNVAEHAPGAQLVGRHHVGSPLEQHHRDAKPPERGLQTVGFPAH